jgi:ubiquinone/menaquinone biosynthesis C-methylase UbiE
MITRSQGVATLKPAVPAYLKEIYWWAYVDPRAVYVFERQWLVNLILWGNFARLRDAALDRLDYADGPRTLQVACVYGDLTTRLVARLAQGSQLDVLDVLPVQLENLNRKLPSGSGVGLIHGNSADMPFERGHYDQALLFFLLHEQPEPVRRATLAETLHVVKPGGRIVIVDYHRPHRRSPLYWLMAGVLRTLEPFALDLWQAEIAEWLPAGVELRSLTGQTLFGGLYQLIVIEV